MLLSVYKQWGYKSSSTQREVINFPLTFTSTIYAIVCQNYFQAFNGSAGWFSSNVGSYTLSKTEIYIADKLGWWITIGIQQWGTYNSGTTWDTYFTFPITFPTACYAGCVADIYDGDKNEDVYYRAQPTTSQFRLRGGAGFNCPHMIIVIGR